MDDVLRLLLLEDSPIDVELIKYELKKSPTQFDFRQAKNKQGFLELLLEFKPNIILSDYTLPQYSGLEALTDAKKAIPDVAFILVTGTLDEETAVECMKAGASDFILKNTLNRLTPAIESALSAQKNALEQANLHETLLTKTSAYECLFQIADTPLALFDLENQTLLDVNKLASSLLSSQHPDSPQHTQLTSLLQQHLDQKNPPPSLTLPPSPSQPHELTLQLQKLPIPQKHIYQIKFLTS